MQGNMTRSQASDNLAGEVLQTGKSRESTFFTALQKGGKYSRCLGLWPKEWHTWRVAAEEIQSISAPTQHARNHLVLRGSVYLWWGVVQQNFQSIVDGHFCRKPQRQMIRKMKFKDTKYRFTNHALRCGSKVKWLSTFLKAHSQCLYLVASC